MYFSLEMQCPSNYLMKNNKNIIEAFIVYLSECRWTSFEVTISVFEDLTHTCSFTSSHWAEVVPVPATSAIYEPLASPGPSVVVESWKYTITHARLFLVKNKLLLALKDNLSLLNYNHKIPQALADLGNGMRGLQPPPLLPFWSENVIQKISFLAILGLQPSFPDRMFEKSGHERLQTPPFFEHFWIRICKGECRNYLMKILILL